MNSYSKSTRSLTFENGALGGEPHAQLFAEPGCMEVVNNRAVFPFLFITIMI